MKKETIICNGGKIASSIICARETGHIHPKEPNWTTFSHHIQKKTQYIADLNERLKAIKLPEGNVGIIKLLQENTGSMLFGNSLGNAFLNMSHTGLPW